MDDDAVKEGDAVKQSAVALEKEATASTRDNKTAIAVFILDLKDEINSREKLKKKRAYQ